jgi:hypothetical protein
MHAAAIGRNRVDLRQVSLKGEEGMRERERRETEREEEKDKDNDRDKDRRKGLNVMDLRPWPPPTLQPGPARLCVPLQYLEESAEVPLVVVFDEHQRWRRRRPLIPPQVRRFHLQRTW